VWKSEHLNSVQSASIEVTVDTDHMTAGAGIVLQLIEAQSHRPSGIAVKPSALLLIPLRRMAKLLICPWLMGVI
jgi:hypothetical protein